VREMIHLKTEKEIEMIANSGLIIAKLFAEIKSLVVPGVDTADLDTFAETFIRSHKGAIPAFKGLYGFPGSVCVSVNEEVVHGIPNKDRVLMEGDILSIDVGVKLNGWCSDSAWTFSVGEIDKETSELLSMTEESLNRAVATVTKDSYIGDIGAAVMNCVEGTKYSIIKDLVGHGIGRDVHEEPQVPNLGKSGHGIQLREGMVLAIEPMLSCGSAEIVTADDEWTIVTQDRSLSAHFEHTVALTSQGARVLTRA
jgi:methionyl aminopeptidase